MESFEPKSQLDNHNQQHSPLQSDPSLDNDQLAQIIAQDIQNLVLSTKDEVKDQAVDVKEVVNETLQSESANSGEETNHRDVDPNECRVLGTGEDLKVKYEVEIEDEVVSSEVGGYEDKGEVRTSEDGDDRGYEHVEDLENVGGDGWEEGSVSVPDDGKVKGFYHPLRLDAEDCSYYMRTGMCKFGSTCRFNHPIRRKNQPIKEIKRQKEEKVERHGQIECKYHTSSAGCKNGRACKFSHGRGKTVKTPVVEFNFVGLPIRPGEKECPYYMRSGSCKYGPSCRFNHPNPTAADSPTTHANDVPRPLQPNIPNMPSWSAPKTPDPTANFVPMMYPPPQNMPPPTPDWKGYQGPAPVPAHIYPKTERALPIPPAFFLNNPPSDTKMYTQPQQPMLVSEYPERPGQPDCTHFMKTGDCKYRVSCKFNHPQNRTTRTLRDQRICAYFSRHGTCKYGSACKYEHPVNHNINSNPAGEGYNRSNGPRPLLQQSV